MNLEKLLGNPEPSILPEPAPVITIFVRHSTDCKYSGDEFWKRCDCRKHFRWTHNGKQYRRKAGTRVWAEAERQKRLLEDQLAGRPVAKPETGKTLEDAIELFKMAKKNQGVNDGVLDKYDRELGRLRTFMERNHLFTAAALSRELLIKYQATWEDMYPSSNTRQMVQARLKSFLRFCYDSKWLDRVPKLDTIKADEPPTMPLTDAEYDRLLKTVPKTFPESKKAPRVRVLILLMRWSGLAISDAVMLRRDAIERDAKRKLHSIVTARQKTGTHVSVPLPPKVAREILAVLNGNEEYLLWTGNGKKEKAATHWQTDLRQLFKDAKIHSAGNMLSHRLRDTFAVDLLQKGVPLEDVSKLLGHESIKTTERHYAKWVKARQDRLTDLVTATWKRN
ncbi:MAG TPA: tyrosine-type recombinase/integrase [Terriglobales bacterium]|nr:tyrosine-type recombinase/integrase [Terriglobales bacterium]